MSGESLPPALATAVAVMPTRHAVTVVSAPGGLSMTLPPVIAEAGDEAGQATFEFFAARIGNDHTRKAYGRAVERFCAWCEAKGETLASRIACTSPRSVTAFRAAA